MNLFGSTRAKQYRLHRWIAAIIGVFILWQIFSGIVWVLPFPSPASRLHTRNKPIQLNSITISLAEAVQNLESYLGRDLKIVSIRIDNPQNRSYYKIEDTQGVVYFIDAETGKISEMNEELAAMLAESKFPGTVPPIKMISRIDEHDLIYPAGSLPAYRIVFDHPHGFISHVSVNEGTVEHSDRYKRIRSIIVGMHDMSLLRLFWNHSLFYRFVLCFFAMVAAGAVVTGYYLAISRQRKKRKFTQKAIIS